MPNLTIMPRANKTTSKNISKKSNRAVTAKVSSPKKTPAKTVKATKKQPPSKKSRFSKQIAFSSIGTSFNKNKERIAHSLKTSKKSRLILGGIIIVALLLLIVPHLVIAMVDGRPITVFSYYSALDKKYGNDTKQQLISEQLIADEAQKRGVVVSDSEVNNQIKQIETQASGSGSLDQILAQQGLTRDEFVKQVKLQSMIKKMFAKGATVSSQEVDQYIAQNKSQLPDPVDNATRVSIKNQLSQQKLVSAFQTWLASASNSSRVIKF